MSSQLPAGFHTRAGKVDDLQAVVDITNASTQADVGVSDATPFSIGRYWQSLDVKLETDSQLIFAADGQPAGYALFMEETPPAPYEVDTWVHPQFKEAGVGEALLQWIDQRAEHALLQAPSDVPASIDHIYVYAQNRSAQQRLEKFGYKHARTFYRMAIAFDGPPPEPQLPANISIRPFRLGQEDRAVYEAFEEAQADEWGHERLPYDTWHHYFIDVEENFDPGAWFLAVEGETIVGYALCRWDRPGEPDRSTVRYLAVRPAWRRRGIALALLHAAFGGIYRHGKRGAGLGVDATSYTGADRLYVRAGMQRAFETLRYRKILRNA